MRRLRSFLSIFAISLLASLAPQQSIAHAGKLFHNLTPEGDATRSSRSDPALNILKNQMDMPAGSFGPMHFDDLAQLEVPEWESKKHRDL
jgi:hypothetical protein